MVHPETAPYRDAFHARTDEPRWLTQGREAALARFTELGFPTRREEAWRFTDLRPLQRAPFPPVLPTVTPAKTGVQGDRAEGFVLAGDAHRLVFVNGIFAPDLSAIGTLPRGVWLASTRETLRERPALLENLLAEDDRARQPFAALNGALFSDGFVLVLDPGVRLERPVEVIAIGHTPVPGSFHLRNAIVLGEGASARLVETSAGQGESWSNAVTELRLAAGASLTHIRIQAAGQSAIDFALARAVLEPKARYSAFTLMLGARLSRQDSQVRFGGEGGECRLDGAYLLRGEQEATTATFIDHAAPHCTTRELFKGVVDDRAHGVFLGTIAVRPDAQKSDAQQLNRNLLLSPRAAVDTKPELEILADDVKCSHGATVGDLDEASLFYLRSRGLTEEDARRLLIEAFATETLDRVEDRPLRDHLAAHLVRWLGGRDA